LAWFSELSWTTNGSGWVILQFWVSTLAAPGIGSGLLNIAESESALNDPFGTTVKSKKDGTLSTMSVSEWNFPTFFANPGIINSVQGSPNPPSPPINGAIFFKEPSKWSKHGNVLMGLRISTYSLETNARHALPA
jgi:hypothetical protein